jgi:TetR/AcrR family tetracycline transcriptional repressor
VGARRRDAASRPARRPLTPGDVVAAGVELLDDVGLAGFTTRALADRLGTYPATLYWHVGNRSQVLAAIVEHVLGEMNVEDPRSIGWKEWLRHASGEYRRVVHAHPHLAPVLVSQLVVNAPATRLVETVLAVLDGAGFRGQDLALAFNAYVGSLVGWVSVELAASPPDIGENWQEAFASTVLSLPAEEFPVIAANREYLADSVLTLRWHSGAERPLDASFEAAVGMWIDGLAARLERRTP